MAAPITIRTPIGDEVLELEEFEGRVERGDIDPSTRVLFPPVTGDRFVPAGELELFERLYRPRALYFQRAFHLGRIPVLTLALSLANVAVYVLETRWPGGIDVEAMVAYGAKAGPLVWDLGQFWRLLTANFVHRDLFHLAFNLFVVFHFGAALENAYRPLDYLAILLASALGTTGLSLAMSDAVSAGASGIAYGMLGGAVVFGIRYRRILPPRYRRVLGSAVLPTVLVFLYMGWTSTGIDNWGHTGGLLAGAAVTLLFPPRLLGDATSPRALLVGRVLPIAAVVLALLLGGRLLDGRLPVLGPVADDRYGLVLDVPAEWRQGADRQGPLTLYNGLSGPARASISVSAHLAELPVDVEEEGRRFVADDLAAEERAGRIEHLAVAPTRFADVGGMRGVVTGAAFVADGARTVLVAHHFARGGLVYAIVLVRPAALPAYDAVFARVLASVRAVEPGFLREARAAALLAPRDPGRLVALADAELRAGSTALAREALERAAALAPDAAGPEIGAARLAFAEGLPRETCAHAARAIRRAPSDPEALAAAALCALARGDRETARARFAEAAAGAPDDGELQDELEELDEAIP